MKESKAAKQARLDAALALLEAAYPDAKPGLDFKNPFELLIATILSAQCTDKQVNKVTAVLFAHYGTPQKLAELTPAQLEPYIKSCGYYHAKGKNIINASKRIVSEFDSQVPSAREALESLPGVGRKTANVVLSNAFGVDAIAVDTHVFRVANRIGFAGAKDVLKTEQQLMQTIPKDKWSKAHHLIISHGRQVCAARNPKCSVCTLCCVCAHYLAKEKTKCT